MNNADIWKLIIGGIIAFLLLIICFQTCGDGKANKTLKEVAKNQEEGLKYQIQIRDASRKTNDILQENLPDTKKNIKKLVECCEKKKTYSRRSNKKISASQATRKVLGIQPELKIGFTGLEKEISRLTDEIVNLRKEVAKEKERDDDKLDKWMEWSSNLIKSTQKTRKDTMTSPPPPGKKSSPVSSEADTCKSCDNSWKK